MSGTVLEQYHLLTLTNWKQNAGKQVRQSSVVLQWSIKQDSPETIEPFMIFIFYTKNHF
jgi:hypothetical protein